MAASMAKARMALRLLQFSKQSRFLVNHPRQCIGVLGQFRRHLADDSSKDGDIAAKPGIELSHPKGKLRQSVEASDSSSSSSSDSGSDSSDGSSSSSDSDGELNPEMVSAAGDVAKALGGDADRTTSELLDQLRSHNDLTQDRKDSQVPRPQISEMFKGMQIHRQRRRNQQQNINKDRRDFSNRRQARDQQPASEEGLPPGQRQRNDPDRGIFAELTNQRQPRGQGEGQETGRFLRARGGGPQMDLTLFDGRGLGIFEKAESTTSVEVSTSESLFTRLQREDLEQQTTLPAENAFEEQIRWTRQGKLWTFPIDNEQGLDEEAKVGFHEHIFLEPLIADFPRKGPIRHFMELVCVGLSKNPYVTVEEKRAHIDWFRNYFAEKKSILDEIIFDPDRVPAGENEARPEVS